MADFGDELDALRRIDPLDPADLVPPEDPTATALFERITMTDTDTANAPAADTDSRRSSTSQRVAWIAAAAAVVALGVGGLILAQGGDSDPDVAHPPGPITPSGLSTGSCVEPYNVQTLANREAAFDGTVVRVDGDRVTFTVNEWYRGGDEPKIILAGASTLAGLTSAGDSLTLEPRTRLLVAGDGGFAWSCGFTQPYDAAVAAQWADTLGRG